ncbi:hypothetical protein ACFLZ8_05055 [Planctomycetota bacterium]
MGKNSKSKKNQIKADKTSQKAFKITANVKTSILQTIGELRAGTDVKVSQHS